MQKERWSPYLTAVEGSPRVRKSHKSEVYEISKERKNITQRLQLMKIRVKQLEREEQKAKLKALNASTLTETIIQRRTEKQKEKTLRNKLQQLKDRELEELKERNRQMKDDIKLRLAMKKESVLENKKISVKIMKEFKEQRKRNKLINEGSEKCFSASPRHLTSSIRVENSKSSVPRVDEEKGKTNDALKEMNPLQALESMLISKLKQAYEDQKTAEEKVAYLINHPVVSSKDELDKVTLRSQSSVSHI